MRTAEQSVLGRVLLFALAAALSILVLEWPSLQHTHLDVLVYRGAVSFWVRGGQLYRYGYGSGHWPFTYPPFAAVCMVPMLAFSSSVLVKINELVIVTAIVVCTRWIVGRLPMLSRHGPWFMTAVLAPIVCLLQPLQDVNALGQIDIVLAGLVLLDLVLLDRESRFAGVGIGLATAIKLTPGLFILFLFVAARRRAAATACAVLGAVTIATALLAPAASWSYWSSVIFDTRRVGLVASATNQSFGGVLARLTGSNHLPAYWLLLVAVITVWGLRSAAHLWRRGEHLVAFTVVGLAATIASPISWIHHLWWIVPALLILADEALRRRSRVLLLGTAAGAVLFITRVPDLTRVPLGHQLTVSTLVGENAYAAACLGVLLLIVYLVSRRRVPNTAAVATRGGHHDPPSPARALSPG